LCDISAVETAGYFRKRRWRGEIAQSPVIDHLLFPGNMTVQLEIAGFIF
jgi:hypothetical protein